MDVKTKALLLLRYFLLATKLFVIPDTGSATFLFLKALCVVLYYLTAYLVSIGAIYLLRIFYGLTLLILALIYLRTAYMCSDELTC